MKQIMAYAMTEDEWDRHPHKVDSAHVVVVDGMVRKAPGIGTIQKPSKWDAGLFLAIVVVPLVAFGVVLGWLLF